MVCRVLWAPLGFPYLGTAAFLTSNYSVLDIDISTGLAAGNYVVALGVWQNMSFAENCGSGTLGDGFIGLGVPGYLGNYYYELNVTRPEEQQPPIPEPATLLLLGSGLAGLSAVRKRRSR